MTWFVLMVLLVVALTWIFVRWLDSFEVLRIITNNLRHAKDIQLILVRKSWWDRLSEWLGKVILILVLAGISFIVGMLCRSWFWDY